MNRSSRTFWEIINEYEIIIPVIQRDYVQGRQTRQVQSAREMLLGEIRDSLSRETPINLNFVYGKADSNDGRSLFIPLDGQQRLTTLFLLHWYALCRFSNHSEAEFETLSRFSYETRKTSGDFFRRLTDRRLATEISLSDVDTTISAQLKDKYWFRPEWLSDPTVNSSLVVIDRIQSLFGSAEGLWEQLSDSQRCPIRFEWLNIEKLGNEDDLYIKMNARGKLLSSFENLKAELHKAAQTVLPEPESTLFFSKLDKDWLDFFWLNSPKDREDACDRPLMNLFHWTLWNQWFACAEGYKTNYSGREDGVFSLQARPSGRTLDDYTKFVEPSSVICKELFKGLEYLLDFVSQAPKDHPIVDIVLNCSTSLNPDYRQRIMLYAASEYLLGQNGLFEEKSWEEWRRVFTNLTACSSRYQGFSNLGQYMGAIRCVHGLRQYSGNLLAAFADESIQIDGFIPNDQIKEERLKAKLILSSPEWENAIYKAEAIGYFQGKIGFLLTFAGLSPDEPFDKHNLPERAYSDFDTYLEILGMLFGDKSLLCDENLFIRALLTKGDFTLPMKRLRCYMIQDHRDIDWRAFLRMYNSEHVRANKHFHQLLNDLRGREGDIDSQLQQIVDESVWDDSRMDWHAKFFIQYPELLAKELGSYHQYRLAEWNNTTPQLCFLPVGSNTVASGHNRELYTSVIAIEARRAGWDAYSTPVTGTQPGEFYHLRKGSTVLRLSISDWQKDTLLVLTRDSDAGQSEVVVQTNNYETVIGCIREL